MINIEDSRDCCGCSACREVCPVNAIQMQYNFEGFRYPKVDCDRCVDCGLCDNVCGFQKREWNSNYTAPPRDCYAFVNSDESTRSKSASGGFYFAAAKEILSRDGCVYGTRWDDDWKGSKVDRATNENDARKFQSSKYVDSIIEYGTLTQVKKDLAQSKWVLFSGLPCQINAVKGFVGDDYEKLICIDLICAGVPSKRVWKAYLESVEKKYGTSATFVNQRDKRNGFMNCGVLISGSTWSYYRSKSENPYMKLYFNYLVMKPSCYQCKPSQNRMSDLTIADLWGVDKFAPQYNDNKGTSLVIVQTEKGKKFLDDIIHRPFLCEKIDFDAAYRYNPNYYRNRYMSEQRLKFFYDFNDDYFDGL